MDALLVYPRFPLTYWGFQYGLRLIGKRAATGLANLRTAGNVRFPASRQTKAYPKSTLSSGVE